MSRPMINAPAERAQRGFSLVELMIAILIALFLLGGLVTLVMGTRRSGANQTAISQLQDNERVAMTLITNVVQKAGYFADPVGQQLSSFGTETFNTVPFVASQVVAGTYNAAAPGDTLLVRFFAPYSDPTASILDCAGHSNPAPSSAPNTNFWFTNMFQVVSVAGTPWLQCQSRVSGVGTVTTVNLIPNVKQIQVLYGVASPGAGTDFSVVQYLNAGAMAGNWLNVTSIKITLTFLQPAYGTTGGQMSTNTVTFTRVIPVMSRAGVDT